jgi:DNA polymerase-3 subunit beta
MTGIKLIQREGKMIAYATDSHQAVRLHVDCEAKKDFDLLFNRNISMAAGLITDSPLTISYTTHHFKIENDDTSLIGQLIEERYPDVESIIAKDNPHSASIDRKLFISELKKAGLFSNRTTREGALIFSEGNLKLSAVDLDYSQEYSNDLPCEYSGDTFEIGINISKVEAMLSVMNEDEVMMEFAKPNQAIHFLETDHLGLSMPVMLRSITN